MTRQLVFLIFLCFLLLAVDSRVALAAGPSATWNELRTKRDALSSFHQEFEVQRTLKFEDKIQAMRTSLVIDYGSGEWRQSYQSGAGNRIKMFDGRDLFEMEGWASQYIRRTELQKSEVPQPDPYSAEHLDLSKAVERDRRSCGLSNTSDVCITLDIPIKQSIGDPGYGKSRVLGGVTHEVLDLTTGLLVGSRTLENLESEHGGYQLNRSYTLKRMSYGGPKDESLFKLPPNATEAAKELPRWNRK